MFSNKRFIRALLFLYLGTSVGLGVLLLSLSYLVTTSVSVNQSVELTLVPVVTEIKKTK